MQDNFDLLREAVGAVVDAEREHLRLGIHHPRGNRDPDLRLAEVARRRDSLMDEVYRHICAVRREGTDPRFSLETVEARLTSLANACRDLGVWNGLLAPSTSFPSSALDPSPTESAAAWLQHVDSQAGELLDNLCEQAARSLQGVLDLAAPSRVQVQEEWLSASQAVEVANERGFPVTLAWISKRKDRIRTRPRQMPGPHKLEVEMGSFKSVLFDEITPAPNSESDEPEGDDRWQIELRKEAAAAAKRQARPLD